VGAWEFTEGSGNVAYDSSGFGNNATLVGAPLWQGGNAGSSLNFNGTTQYATANNTWTFGQPVTVVSWVNMPGGSPGGSLFGFGVSIARLQAHVPYSDNVLYWDYGDSSNGRISTSFSAYLNKPTHVVLVNDGKANGSAFKGIYISGALITSGTSNTAVTGTATGFQIGNFEGLNPVHGNISDFRLYNRVLSAAEIVNDFMRTGP
jgi:hypothetical protein